MCSFTSQVSNGLYIDPFDENYFDNDQSLDLLSDYLLLFAKEQLSCAEDGEIYDVRDRIKKDFKLYEKVQDYFETKSIGG